VRLTLMGAEAEGAEEVEQGKKQKEANLSFSLSF